MDIAHQLDDMFSTEYAYATTDTLGSFSAAATIEKPQETFKEAMGLPQATLWKAVSDREIASLEKHRRLRAGTNDRGPGGTGGGGRGVGK